LAMVGTGTAIVERPSTRRIDRLFTPDDVMAALTR